MKSFFRYILPLLVLYAGVSRTHAQVQPVLTVGITRIVVSDDGTTTPPTPPVSQTFNTPNEAYGPAGKFINIYASATGTFPVGGFNYNFFVNGISIGKPPNVSPGVENGLSWTPPAPGAYSIYVTASDGANSATSLPVRFFAVGAVVTNPLPGTLVSVGSAIVVKADATPRQGLIDHIDFYDNGAKIGTSVNYPYSLIYVPAGPAGTVHSLSVRAFDNAGNPALISPSVSITMIAPVGTPPVVVITTPPDNGALAIPNYATASAAGILINVSAAPISPAAQILKVETYIDGVLLATTGTFPYSFNWQPLIPKRYTIVALAYDDKGNVGVSTTIHANIVATPTVAITSPTASSSVSAGSPVTVTANAGGGTGASVSSVQFFADGKSIGSANTPTSGTTYSITFTPTLKTDGSNTTLSAVVTDTNGLSTTSLPVNIVVNAGTGGGGGTIGQPPVVSLASPTPGSNFPVNSPVTLTASATDPDGNIVNVQFYVNGTLLTTDSTYPYSTTWTPVSLGTYTLTAKATDNSGNSVIGAPVTVTVGANSSGLPTVAITAPASNIKGTVTNSIVVTANASDADGSVTLVEFYADGTLIGSRTTAPYAVVWNPATAKTYQLTAAVTDDGGNRVISSAVPVIIASPVGSIPYGVLTISNPTIDSSTVAAPTALAPVPVSLGSKLIISAAGVDSDGFIARVDFYANGTQIASISNPPFAFVWQLTTLDSVTISAVVTDNSGNAYNTLPIIISPVPSVAASSAVVTLNSPTDGATYSAGSQIIFNASTNLGNINPPKVDFYINGQQFQTVTGPPYQYTVGLTQPGTYLVQAVARSGTIVTASGISRITIVANQAPTVALTAPSTGATYKFGSTINLTANASDPDGTIQSVQFFVNGSALSTDTTSPYNASFTPAAEGVYTLTAVTTDNAGISTTSAPITVLVFSSTSTNTDAVYTGTYGFGNEAGTFAAIVTGGKRATFIAHSTSGPAKTFYYTGLPVNAAGGFSATDSTGKKLLSVTSTDGSSLTGTLDGGRLVLIGINPGVFSQNTYGGAGMYTGNVMGRSTSTLTAIVGADASIMLYIADGSFADAGDGTIDSSTGTFTISTVGGNKFTGKVDATTHFVTGTLSGSSGGAFTAALESGGMFSDGVLRGLSTRGFVGTGNNLLIAGFVVNGTNPKNVLIRAIGPSLAGVSNVLADPQLKVFKGASLIASNDNWGNDPKIVAATTAVGIGQLSATSLDAVVYTSLAPGAYTAQINGANSSSGNALIEIYDADTMAPFSTQRINAISTRGFVGTSGNELISGFIITGTAPKKVLIEAVGPGISSNVSGTLSDPSVQLISANGQTVRENDNWETGNDPSLVSDAITKSAATPLAAGSKDAAILISLPPGAYTAVVRGSGGATGIALINVFEVP